MIDKEIPKGFYSMGKVYIVDSDNGESWEDAFHYVDKIFTSREVAEKYLMDIGCVENKSKFGDTWSFPKYVCSMNNMNCEDCLKREQDVDEGGYRYCEEEFKRDESEYDNSFYTIEEYDLLTDMCTFHVHD